MKRPSIRQTCLGLLAAVALVGSYAALQARVWPDQSAQRRLDALHLWQARPFANYRVVVQVGRFTRTWYTLNTGGAYGRAINYPNAGRSAR